MADLSPVRPEFTQRDAPGRGAGGHDTVNEGNHVTTTIRNRGHRPLLAALAATLLTTGCGGSDAPPPAGGPPPPPAFSGALSDGAILSVSGLPVASGAIGTLTALTGSVTQLNGGTVFLLTGTHNSAGGGVSLDSTTPGYGLDGTLSGGVLRGTYTTPSGSGTFVAMTPAGGAVARYCGSYDGDEAGVINVLVSGTGAHAAVSAGHELAGEVSGTTLTLLDPAGPATVTGTLDPGVAVSGAWSSPGGSGTWSASVAGCTPAPVACPSTTFLTGSVTETKHMAAQPAAAGGDIRSGTYVLTAVHYYAQGGDGTGTSTFRGQMIIDGNAMTQLWQSDGGAVRSFAKTFTYSLSAKTITQIVSRQCPAGSGPPAGTVDDPLPYTADDTSITLFDQPNPREPNAQPRALVFTNWNTL